MCAIYGFLQYGDKGLSNKMLRKLIKNLSIEAEVRGTHATGISYAKNGKMVTYKQPKPAHKVKLKFPKKTRAVIGHTRYTTQGSEKLNYNNHPFEGESKNGQFALAHNGVLWNDIELRIANNLPDTHIETDSYIAVQLIENQEYLDHYSLQCMAELLQGSFMLTILREDNTLFLVKGDNPIELYHFPELGLYVYASTKDILDKALKATKIKGAYETIVLHEGDIFAINPDGTTESSQFDAESAFYAGLEREIGKEEEEELRQILMWTDFYGIDEEDIYTMLDYGWTTEDLWDMIDDPDVITNEIMAIKENCVC